MMGRYERTEMGGKNEGFETTHWSEILSARTLDGARRRAATNTLLAQYWKPVYCYLRRKGYDNEDAKDLTQGFFQEVVLGRDLIQRADQEKGRFRTLLLTALDRYVTSVHRAGTARKRQPARGLVSLDGVGSANVPEPVAAAAPDRAFHHAWAAELVETVLAEVRRACLDSGKSAHWAVFYERVVRPITDNVAPTPLPDLCARLGIEDEAKASNMIVTVKRRFQATLRRHVLQFVDSDSDVDAEIADLMNALASRGAGP